MLGGVGRNSRKERVDVVSVVVETPTAVTESFFGASSDFINFDGIK
jgi:hypothetical protein